MAPKKKSKTSNGKKNRGYLSNKYFVISAVGLVLALLIGAIVFLYDDFVTNNALTTSEEDSSTSKSSADADQTPKEDMVENPKENQVDELEKDSREQN